MKKTSEKEITKEEWIRDENDMLIPYFNLNPKPNASQMILELERFCEDNGFKPIFNDAEMLEEIDLYWVLKENPLAMINQPPIAFNLKAEKGAVRIYAGSYFNDFRLVTSTGTRESCALTDLEIKAGSLFINGKEFVV